MKVRPAVIILKEDSILTMRYKYGEKEVFALPGGNPDPEESLPDALRRELMEELGVDIEIDDMILCGEVLWAEMKKETLHMLFSAKIENGSPILNPLETTALEIVWLPIAELQKRLMYPNVGTEIQQYISGQLSSSYVGVIDQPYAE